MLPGAAFLTEEISEQAPSRSQCTRNERAGSSYCSDASSGEHSGCSLKKKALALSLGPLCPVPSCMLPVDKAVMFRSGCMVGKQLLRCLGEGPWKELWEVGEDLARRGVCICQAPVASLTAAPLSSQTLMSPAQCWVGGQRLISPACRWRNKTSTSKPRAGGSSWVRWAGVTVGALSLW